MHVIARNIGVFDVSHVDQGDVCIVLVLVLQVDCLRISIVALGRGARRQELIDLILGIGGVNGVGGIGCRGRLGVHRVHGHPKQIDVGCVLGNRFHSGSGRPFCIALRVLVLLVAPAAVTAHAPEEARRRAARAATGIAIGRWRVAVETHALCRAQGSELRRAKAPFVLFGHGAYGGTLSRLAIRAAAAVMALLLLALLLEERQRH